VLYGTCFNLITVTIALLGANLFSLAVSFIFFVMFACYLVSVFSIFIRGPTAIELKSLDNATAMFTGLSAQTLRNNLNANYSLDYTNENVQTSFGYLFSVLFSSLVGVMAGANMSGELKKPSKSIPRGTLAGVLFVFILYSLQNLLLAASCER
jgi:potassium/chloride transporter 9